MATITARTPEETIRYLAHKFWEEEGRPDGRADAHWQRALDAVTKVGSVAPKKASAPKVPAKAAPAKAAAQKPKTTR